MAGVLARTAFRMLRRPNLMVAATRGDKMMPDPIEHATGLERKELEAYARGNDDPLHNKPIKKGPGTKAQPTMIPSFNDKRIIGCVCEPDAFYINYMWLHEGDPKRCECGHWYKLFRAEDPWKDIM